MIIHNTHTNGATIADIMRKLDLYINPVTKAVYRDILAKRLQLNKDK